MFSQRYNIRVIRVTTYDIQVDTKFISFNQLSILFDKSCLKFASPGRQTDSEQDRGRPDRPEHDGIRNSRR